LVPLLKTRGITILGLINEKNSQKCFHLQEFSFPAPSIQNMTKYFVPEKIFLAAINSNLGKSANYVSIWRLKTHLKGVNKNNPT